MAGHGEAEVRKFVKTSLAVFSTLLVLTLVTVGISYLHLETPAAIAVGLVVATVKASLVALFFMHLIAERHAVYYLLGLTGLFFVVLMYLPSAWIHDEVKVHSVWDVLPAPVDIGHGAGGDAHDEAHDHGGAEDAAHH
jgi:cytochrome c oxidase subunit 4